MKIQKARQPRSAVRRRAAVYVAVLGASLLLMVIGLAGLLAVRAERRSSQDVSDLTAARFHAHSAVEIALLCLMDETIECPTDLTIDDNGSFTLEGIDEIESTLSDLLNTDPLEVNLLETEPLDLAGIGYAGRHPSLGCYRARYRLRVQLNIVSLEPLILEVEPGSWEHGIWADTSDPSLCSTP